MSTGINLTILVCKGGANGAPPTFSRGVPPPVSILTRLDTRLDTYEHSITARGGFESLQGSFAATLPEALWWLTQLRQQLLSIYVADAHARTVWEGYIQQIVVSLGDETITLSLDGMRNAIKIRYSDAATGAQAASAFVTSTTSIAQYGRKESVLSVGKILAADATALITTALNAYSQPVSQRGSQAQPGQGGGEVRVSLVCKGWYDTLRWLTTSNAATTAAVTTTQATGLLTAYTATNAFVSSDYTNVVASGYSATQAIAADTTYQSAIDTLLGYGTSANQRQAWGIYEGRIFVVGTWAGATPTSIDYVRHLGNTAIATPTGQHVDPWMVRPDAIYQVPELLDPLTAGSADSAAQYYVERVSCSITTSGATARLEPANTISIDSILARLH